MKTYIILAFSILIGGWAFCQGNLDFSENKAFIPKKVNFETSSFQIEDKSTLKIYGGVPNSMIYCYDQPQGGTLIRRSLTDYQGNIELSFESDKSPSFILNTPYSINGSAKGNGFVQYLDKKDFIVQNIILTKDGNTLYLNFESLVNPDKGVTYELISQNETGEISIVQSFETNKEKAWEDFDFECSLEPRTQYRFQVKSQGEERYNQDIFNSEGQVDFVVYPQVSTESIFVEFEDVVELSTFTIIDSKGIQHLKGEVTDLKTKVEVGHLAAGSYFIRLDKYPKDPVLFIKQ